MASPNEGESSPPAAAPTLREGRYAVVGSLGRGSQAETLDAVDKRDGRAVAIKRFAVQHATSWKDVELAQREANVLATLQHPQLPRYIEHFEEAGALYLVMEKVEGRSLAKRDHGFDQAQVLRFLSDVGECLRYLHGRAPPIIHRDIKPSNVIQRTDGSFCLVDFGSVRDRLKPEGGSTVVGTFGFMAPEQFQGRALPASDVYAVGATALTLLTGTEPQDLPHKGLAIDVNAALQGHFDPRLVNALSHMLQPDPEQRAGSVQAALRAVRLDPNAPPPAAAREQGAARGHHAAPKQGASREQHAHDPARRNSNAGTWQQRAVNAAAAYVDDEVARAFSDSARNERARDRAERLTTHRQRKRAEQRERQDQKRAERRRRRALSPRPRIPPGVILGIFLLLVFRVAALATWMLFAFLLPLLFRILSMFDQRLLRVADRMLTIAERGTQGLAHAGDHIRYQFLGGPMPWTVDTSAEDVTDAADAEADTASTTGRVRVSDAEDAEEPEVEPDGAPTRPKRESRS